MFLKNKFLFKMYIVTFLEWMLKIRKNWAFPLSLYGRYFQDKYSNNSKLV